MKTISVYTDGACSGNPGPGGYGVVLISGNRRKELSQGFRLTTNNRMELMAAIAALEALSQPSQVQLYTDSKYLADAINLGWARNWRARGWKRGRRQRAQNPDLWAKLLDLFDDHQVTVHWVKGHDGNPENERSDRLAVRASQQENLPPDEGYEQKDTGSPAVLF